VEKSIKLKRVESVLRELIPEAISSLSDSAINNAQVLDVICSRGKYDAQVFLDPSFSNEDEQKQIVKSLSKASSYIENYCKQAEGWYRAPKMKFIFDHTLERQNKLDSLFDKISKELHKNDK
jgi:ribosome-binding factor A